MLAIWPLVPLPFLKPACTSRFRMSYLGHYNFLLGFHAAHVNTCISCPISTYLPVKRPGWFTSPGLTFYFPFNFPLFSSSFLEYSDCSCYTEAMSDLKVCYKWQNRKVEAIWNVEKIGPPYQASASYLWLFTRGKNSELFGYCLPICLILIHQASDK